MRTSCQEFASHTRTVRSEEPETIWVPSGEKVMDLTGPVCPSRGPANRTPVLESHTQIVLSDDPDKTCPPFGEKATELTELICP